MHGPGGHDRAGGSCDHWATIGVVVVVQAAGGAATEEVASGRGEGVYTAAVARGEKKGRLSHQPPYV